MKGFAYEVPERFRGPTFHNRTYEKIRANRENCIRLLKIVHDSNMSYTDRRFVVYVAVNKINNKLYVGKTAAGLETRIKRHFNESKKGTRLFCRAIRKYGREAFEFYIFCVCKDESKLSHYEQSLIAAIMPEYNLTAGGEGMTGYKPSPETLKKLSESHKGQIGNWTGKKRDPKHIAKMVATRKERGHYIGPLKGQRRPDWVVEKIKQGLKNGKKPKPLSPEMVERRSKQFKEMNAKQARPVRCLNDGLEFPSIKLAAMHYNIAISQLGRTLHREVKQTRGLTFEFI